MGIIVTESVCWRKFVRAGLGRYSEALLSWYFRSPMPWDVLLSLSVRLLLDSFGSWEGVLVLDDTGKRRAKVTKRIPYVHYFKDKQGSGTIRGQEVVFLVLVTPLVTIPVGFAFYQPDPAYSAWAKQDRRLKRRGVAKSKRPAQPPVNPEYPTKQQLALALLEQFAHDHPLVQVKAILADALYGSAQFMAQAAAPFGELQVISQLRYNQKVRFRGRSWRLEEYFRAYPGVPQTVRIRGGEPVEVWVSSARLYVEAQNCKRFVVAIRYPEQNEYRYLVASELSWRTLDIVQAHTLRWLVELIFKACKNSLNANQISSADKNIIESLLLASLAAQLSTYTILEQSIEYLDSQQQQSISFQRLAQVAVILRQEFILFLLNTSTRYKTRLIEKIILFSNEIYDPNYRRRSSSLGRIIGLLA